MNNPFAARGPFSPGNPQLEQQLAGNRAPNRNVGRDLYKPENWNTNNSGAVYSCSMSSEPNGGNLTWLFDPDPQSVHWDMSMINQVVPTHGGQVTYAKWRQIGPLRVMGQLRSTYDLLQLSFFIKDHMVEAVEQGTPLLFEYPERDIAFHVYCRSFAQIGIDTKKTGDMVPMYQIVFDITRDHIALKTVPLSQLGIPENVGWMPISEETGAAEKEKPGSTLSGQGAQGQGTQGQPNQDGLNSNGQAPASNPPSSGQ